MGTLGMWQVRQSLLGLTLQTVAAAGGWRGAGAVHMGHARLPWVGHVAEERAGPVVAVGAPLREHLLRLVGVACGTCGTATAGLPASPDESPPDGPVPTVPIQL